MKQPFLRNTLFMLAAVGIAAIPGKALAHQVQTNYILNSQTENSQTERPFESLRESQVNLQPGESLELQSTFSNGQPLKGATVTVHAPGQPDRVWAKGLTDSQGRYTFTPDESISGEWEVSIKRDGHQDIIMVPVSEARIQTDLIAQGSEIKDVHYASSPLMAVGGLAIAAASIGFARYSTKKSAE